MTVPLFIVWRKSSLAYRLRSLKPSLHPIRVFKKYGLAGAWKKMVKMQ
jgi:hypothetical protein